MYRKQGGRQERREENKEFEEQLVELRRVTRTVAGGKRLSFRAAVVIGNRKGKVGLGVGKGKDVSTAISKAVEKAKKNIFEVPITDKGSITHYLRAKFKASRVLLRPAPEGHGIIAGGPVRVVLELAGFSNITAKMLGSRNKINSLKATIKAFQNLRK